MMRADTSWEYREAFQKATLEGKARVTGGGHNAAVFQRPHRLFADHVTVFHVRELDDQGQPKKNFQGEDVAIVVYFIKETIEERKARREADPTTELARSLYVPPAEGVPRVSVAMQELVRATLAKVDADGIPSVDWDVRWVGEFLGAVRCAIALPSSDSLNTSSHPSSILPSTSPGERSATHHAASLRPGSQRLHHLPSAKAQNHLLRLTRGRLAGDIRPLQRE